MNEQPLDLSGTTVEVRDRDGVKIVAVTGDVDMATVEPVRDVLMTELDQRPARLLVDLREVSFFGSAGLNTLLTAHDLAARRGVSLALVTARQVVLRPLACTAVEELFRIYPTLTEALRVA